MAENKKTKVDWKDALASKKADPRKETALVEVGGRVIKIVRNDMTDEEWAHAKKNEVKSLPVETTYDDDKPAEKPAMKPGTRDAADKSLDWGTIRRLSTDLRQVSDSIVSPDQKALVEKMDDDSRADYLRERFRRKGYRVPDSTSAEDRLSDAKEREEEGASPKKEKSEAGGVLGQALKFIKGATPWRREAYIKGDPQNGKNPEDAEVQWYTSRDGKRRIRIVRNGRSDAEIQRELESHDDPDLTVQEPVKGGKVQPRADADPGMSVRGQMMRMAQGATPNSTQPLTKEQADQKYAEEYEGSKYVVPQEAKEVAGAVTRGASAVGDVAGKVGSGLAQAGSELAAAPSKVGEGLAKAGSELAAMPGKALGQLKDASDRLDAQVAPVVDGAVDAVGNFLTAPVRNFAGNAAAVVGASPESQASAEQMVNGGGDFNPKQGLRELGAFFGGGKAPVEPPDGEPLPGQVIPPTRNPDGTPKVAPPVAPGSQSASASMSVTPSVASPKVGVVGSSDNFSKSIGEVEANNERIAKANADFVATSDKALADKQAMRLKYAQDAEEANKLAIQAKLTAVEEAQKLQARRQMVLEKVREAASTPIDPNRYWNNKSDGQKAMAVIAGALFGFTGQGMNWLQRLDGLVENDNRLQAADRASKMQGLQAEAAGLGELARDAIANGASLAEARLLEKQGKYEGLMMNLQNMADMTENAQVKVKAAEAVGLLSERVAGLRAQQDQLSLARAAQINQNRFKQAELDLEARKFNLTMQAKAAEGQKARKLTELKPSQQERLSGLLTLGNKIAEMSQEYKTKAGSWYAPATANMGLGMQATEASKWKNSSQKFYAQTIGTTLEEGKLTDADFPKYVEGFIPSATDTDGAAANKMKNLAKYAADKYRNELKTIEAGNFFIQSGQLPTPEQYEQELLKQMGMTPAAPAYATEK